MHHSQGKEMTNKITLIGPAMLARPGVQQEVSSDEVTNVATNMLKDFFKTEVVLSKEVLTGMGKIMGTAAADAAKLLSPLLNNDPQIEVAALLHIAHLAEATAYARLTDDAVVQLALA